MTGGLAHVCLVTSHMTVTRARIEMNIPRKRAGSSDHRKATSRFYEAVYQVQQGASFGGDFERHEEAVVTLDSIDVPGRLRRS